MHKQKRYFSQILSEYDNIAEALGAYSRTLLRVEIGKDRYKLWTSEGVNFLIPVQTGPAHLWHIWRAYQHLAQNGFTRMAAWHVSSDGMPFVEVNNRCCYLLESIEGVDFLGWDPGHLSAAVKTMAQYHLASAAWEMPGDPRNAAKNRGGWLQEIRRKKQEMENLFELMERSERKEERKNRLLAGKNKILGQAQQALEELSDGPLSEVESQEDKRGGFIHAEFNDGNFVVIRKGEVWLQGFGSCKPGMRLEDLGNFIIQYGDWDLDKTIFIIRHYHKEDQLTREEMQILPAFLRFPFDCWIALKRWAAGNEIRKDEVKKIFHALDARQDFLAALACLSWNFLEKHLESRDFRRKRRGIRPEAEGDESRYFKLSPGVPPVLLPYGEEGIFTSVRPSQGTTGTDALQDSFPPEPLVFPPQAKYAPERSDADWRAMLSRLADLENKMEQYLSSSKREEKIVLPGDGGISQEITQEAVEDKKPLPPKEAESHPESAAVSAEEKPKTFEAPAVPRAPVKKAQTLLVWKSFPPPFRRKL